MKLYSVTVEKTSRFHVPVVSDNEESAIEYVKNNKYCIQEMRDTDCKFDNNYQVASVCLVTKDNLMWDEDIIVVATNDLYIDATISDVLCEDVMPNTDDTEAWNIYEKCKKDVVDNMEKSKS